MANTYINMKTSIPNAPEGIASKSNRNGFLNRHGQRAGLQGPFTLTPGPTDPNLTETKIERNRSAVIASA